ncbi:MAG: ABC transporter transmembrane domain-containing protein, partial [Acidimicrobiales bacterium]
MGPVEGNQVTTDADRARPQPAGGRGNGHGRGAAGAAPSAPANGREVDPASSRVDVGSPPGGPAENGINQSPGAGHGGSAEDGEADFWDQVAGVVPAPAAEADVAVSKPPRRGGRKKKPESELKRVVRLLTTYSGGRRVYLWSLFLLTVEAVSSIFQPYPIAYLIDYFNSKRPPLDFIEAPFLQSPRVETLLILTVGLILLTMFNSLADSWAEISLARGGRTLGYNTRQALYQRLHRLSLAFHGHRRSGDMITRVTSDVRDVEDFVVDSVSDLAGSILVLVGTLAFLFYKSWQVAIVAILIVPILSFVSNYFSQRIKVSSKKLRAREGDLANTASEMLSSIRVIQTYGRSAYEEKRFADHSRSAMEAALETAGLKARFSWVVAVMEAVVISIVAWLSISLLDSEAITVGTLVLFVILIQNMFKPTRKIIREWTVIGKIFAATERIAEVLDREYAVADRPGAIAAPALTGRVAFDNVSFSYQLDAEDAAEAETGDGGPVKRVALTGVSFELEPGQVVALVGASGAGKSTIAQLIPRLYDPDEGQVRFDGTDIADFTLDSLRAQVSVVLQETILFSGTVAENIAYGREDASQEDVVEAAIKAQAHQFVLELPDGYDTVLGERGANLSGGQRQRLAIARAFIRNTPILILDEPTTGLDSAASEQVIRALETLMQGKTTLIISHDLHLVQSADLIMVLAAGQIVQQGRHRQLLAEPGPYADFCALSGLVAAPEVPEVPAADLDSPDSEGSGADSGNDRSPGGEATAGINADSNGGWHPALSSGHGAGRGRRRGSFREYGRQLSQRLADLSGSVPVVGPLGAGPGRPSSTGPRPSAPLATGPPALGRGDDPSASGPVSIPDPKWVGASPGPSATLPDPVGPSEPELPAAPTTGNAPPTQAGTTAPALSPLLDLDPRTAGAIGQAIPGLALALDSGPMAEVLDRAMFSGAGSRRRVLSVQPGKAMLLAGEPGGGAATVRYQVELLDPITGRRGEELVLGRLFCGPAEAEAYRQKVEVLAAALAGRQGLGGQGPLVAAPPGA